MARQSIAQKMNQEFKSLERFYYLKALRMAKGRVVDAAKLLKVSRSLFFKKVKELDITYSTKRIVLYSLDE